MNPGIHTMTMQDYLRLPALSASTCNTILQYSPFHARYEIERGGDEPSEASEIGTAIHDGLLEGIDRIAVIEADDWRTKAAKEARDAARADGKIPMLARKVTQVREAIAAAEKFIEASEIGNVFKDGRPEQTIVWQEGALTCKARPDWLTHKHDIMLHVKTTQGSAQPDNWIRNQLVPAGYDVAAMFYEAGLSQFVERCDHSVFLVIEQNPPYGCSLIGLSPSMQDLASRKVERAIRTWAECKRTNKYPSYPTAIHYAESMAWQETEEEIRQMVDPLQEKYGLQI